jgi:hypothetical protein
MKRIVLSFIALVLLSASVVVAAPASAQTSKTKSITEAQINASYRVTNPHRRQITSISVDLRPGQVVITSNYLYPSGKTAVTETVAVPFIQNGRIFWSVTSRSRNGEAVSQDLLNQINASSSSSWRSYFRGQLPTGRVTAVTITDTEVIVTYTAAR